MVITDNSRIIQSELGSNEKLLWTGQPNKGLLWHSADYILVPFMLLWMAMPSYTLFSITTGQQKTTDPVEIAVLSLFTAIGTYMVFGRFLIDAWLRGRTYYGLTNQRVIVVMQFFDKKVKSLDIAFPYELEMVEKRDGSGSITFLSPEEAGKKSRQSSPFKALEELQNMNSDAQTKLEKVSNIRHIHNLIREAHQAASRPTV